MWRVGLGRWCGLLHFVREVPQQAIEGLGRAGNAGLSPPMPAAPSPASFGEYISFIFSSAPSFTVSGASSSASAARPRLPSIPRCSHRRNPRQYLWHHRAAMILIPPFLRIKQGPHPPLPHIFFIFIIIAMSAGSLTPIGDPAAFLGHLKGVPFWWVLEHCCPCGPLPSASC